ncbi:hypothetical protein [Liquorilactobacillus nagelii]|jgi:hypothetical protein|uniref:hypothetical protein n=1 Tax=Liquorilactobacillus nagelii TaxID=82688 RepID=UPI00242F409C|nr:hypothetical protein [Liquorilactobacillus nagelii]MCI1700013.1 hypothetical protein [Liquorilactobacillus nagelii]
MKYKCGDKVVFKVDGADVSNLNSYSGQFLGKLEDFQPAEKKIKMTAEEKKEFDEILEESKQTTFDLDDFLNDICDYYKTYPVLHKKLFGNEKAIVNRKKQFEFARALENPDLVEVEKPKKYYVHLFPGECGYLNKFRDTGDYELDNKDNTSDYCTAFTKEEIAKIPQDALKITDKALEGVEEDE